MEIMNLVLLKSNVKTTTTKKKKKKKKNVVVRVVYRAHTAIDNFIIDIDPVFKVLNSEKKTKTKTNKHTKQTILVMCHKLVLKSVSYPKIVKNTPSLIEQSIACNVYT